MLHGEAVGPPIGEALRVGEPEMGFGVAHFKPRGLIGEPAAVHVHDDPLGLAIGRASPVTNGGFDSALTILAPALRKAEHAAAAL